MVIRSAYTRPREVVPLRVRQSLQTLPRRPPGDPAGSQRLLAARAGSDTSLSTHTPAPPPLRLAGPEPSVLLPPRISVQPQAERTAPARVAGKGLRCQPGTERATLLREAHLTDCRKQRGWKRPRPREAAERRQHAAGRRGVPQHLSAHPAAEKGGPAAPRGAPVPGLAALTRRTCWCRLSQSRAAESRRWAAGAAPPGRPYPAARRGLGARRASWRQRPRNDPALAERRGGRGAAARGPTQGRKCAGAEGVPGKAGREGGRLPLPG